MAMLHTVNKSPFDRRSLDVALTHAAKGAGVLMIEDAVLGAIKGTAVTAKSEQAL